jgi:rubrerythrin
MIDTLIVGFDRALRTLSGTAVSARPLPGAALPEAELARDERRQAGALMRVNHTGEVCAQALYSAQSMVARDPAVKSRFAAAAREEEDHLAWTAARLAALGDHPSRLNPLWYAGYVKLNNDRNAAYTFNINGYSINTTCTGVGNAADLACGGGNGKPDGWVFGMIHLF